MEACEDQTHEPIDKSTMQGPPTGLMQGSTTEDSGNRLVAPLKAMEPVDNDSILAYAGCQGPFGSTIGGCSSPIDPFHRKFGVGGGIPAAGLR